MLETTQHRSAKRIAIVMALALVTTGCALPNISMPSIPFVSGEPDPDKETWREARARKKEERIAAREERDQGSDRDSRSSRQDTRDDQFFDRDDPYDNRRPTSRSTRTVESDLGPSGISPYADERETARRPAASGMMQQDNREPQLRGEPMQRSDAEPMTAEEIGQMASVSTNARRATRPIGDLQPLLRSFDRIYTPRGVAPFPTVIFFHGCEGSTKSHETDWAGFYTGLGYAMIAVDSISGREISWEDVCNMQNLNPAERAADVFASVDYARGLPFVDGDQIILTGFAHGAATVWASLLLASSDMPPIGIRSLPREGLQGVQAAYMFYGPCLSPWSIDISAVSFIGENDRYIDPRDCARSARKANVLGVDFDYEIYPGATHTFDHRKPNEANREAGSVYDRKATEMAQSRIKEHLARNIRK